MSWLRRHAFNVHTKDLSIEQKTLFEITSHKDHIGHDLNILFTYFNNFEDLYFLKNIAENIHSETTAPNIDVKITRTGAIPYTAYDTAIAGSSARITSDITFVTVSLTLI